MTGATCGAGNAYPSGALEFTSHLSCSIFCFLVLGRMNKFYIWQFSYNYQGLGGRHGCDRMVVGITTAYAISAYYHLSCDFEPRSWRGVINTTLCDKVCQ